MIFLSVIVWIHYQNKYVELLDTLFMVVRKNNHQISFLHTCHHILLIWAWFLNCKLSACTGDSYFGATVNSFIHVIMYSYYFLKLLNKKVSRTIKQMITKLQLIQFVTCAIHAIWCIYTNYMINMALIQLFVMINMLYLFRKFYIQAYSTTAKKIEKKKKKKKKKKKGKRKCKRKKKKQRKKIKYFSFLFNIY